MKVNYDILKNLIRCNNGMKFEFRDNTNILDVYIYQNVILSIKLNDSNIKNNSEIIYNAITNLENITIYIPKIYIKEI